MIFKLAVKHDSAKTSEGKMAFETVFEVTESYRSSINICPGTGTYTEHGEYSVSLQPWACDEMDRVWHMVSHWEAFRSINGLAS